VLKQDREALAEYRSGRCRPSLNSSSTMLVFIF
jgi:hypothetical protein